MAPPGVTNNIGTVAGIAPKPSTQITAPAITGVSNPIDLRLNPWPVRDQGQRGTCVAFAASGCVEQHFVKSEPPNPDFSEQFLYHQIKTSSSDPNKTTDGTWLEFARDMLHRFGICHEPLAPYVGPGPINPVSGPSPSTGAIADALPFALSAGVYQRKPASPAATILTLLQKGRPVAASFPVFTDPLNPAGTTNWTTAIGWTYGRVFDPPLHAVAKDGHCVCITGFVPDSAEPTGGYFILRNSWGRKWSSASPSIPNYHAPEVGYGEISAGESTERVMRRCRRRGRFRPRRRLCVACAGSPWLCRF